ncbi:MAG TPA: serine hydrolase domain-containing protein [Chitinophagaceae bacterium]|jgi:CubicO group peptidase (beta-lactamase class C family)|nr:serine hydrolase domain-containing protein [Chitinophagaceae bacterium]
MFSCRVLPLALAALFFVACKTQNSTTLPPLPQRDSLTAALERLYSWGHFTGFGVAIVTGNGKVYRQGFGYAERETARPYTEKTVQNIGSVSKTVIGLALLKAQELGRLRLDDPVNRYLPFPVSHPRFPDQPITIRHLATHTSGVLDTEAYAEHNYILKPGPNGNDTDASPGAEVRFNAPGAALPLGGFLEKVLTPAGAWYREEGFSPHAPGNRYAYTNIGAALAAYVVEGATGVPFDVFTRKHIFGPLGMKATGWKFAGIDFTRHSRIYQAPGKPLPYYSLITYPDGNLITSVSDLCLYLSELIRGYAGRGRILSKESYAELFRPQLVDRHFGERNERNPYNDGYNTGIFMGISAAGYIGHTGSDPGVGSLLFFDPRTLAGRILLVNTGFTGKESTRTFFALFDLLETHRKEWEIRR